MKIVIYIFFYIIEALIFFWFCESTIGESKYRLWKKLFAVICVHMILFVLAYFDSISLDIVAALVLYCLTIKVIYNQQIMNSFFNSITLTAVMAISELGVWEVCARLNINVAAALIGNNGTFYISILSSAVSFILLFVISAMLRKNKANGEMSLQEWPVIIVPVLEVGDIILLNSMCTATDVSEEQENIALLSVLVSLMIIMASVAIYTYVQKLYHDNLKEKMMLHREECNVEYYKALICQDEKQKILIHDIKKHLNSISDMLDNDDRDGAVRYINQLCKSKAIKEKVRFSDNIMVNVILNRYAERFLEEEIRYDFDIRNGSLDYILPEDITVILCNMLDNAYEGMKGIMDAQVDLSVTGGTPGGNVVISMINDCSGSSAAMKTKKKNSKFHGYGIKSIENTVEKYRGKAELYYSHIDKKFHTIVLLNVPDDKNEKKKI